MPRLTDMIESKFIKKDDVDPAVLYTITKCVQHDVSLENEPQRLKWCLEFAETDKPLVLNVTNMRLCESIYMSDNTDDWIGKPLVLYNDPSIMYAGKITGGVRVRPPKNQAPAAPAQPAAPGPAVDEEIPF